MCRNARRHRKIIAIKIPLVSAQLDISSSVLLLFTRKFVCSTRRWKSIMRLRVFHVWRWVISITARFHLALLLPFSECIALFSIHWADEKPHDEEGILADAEKCSPTTSAINKCLRDYEQTQAQVEMFEHSILVLNKLCFFIYFFHNENRFMRDDVVEIAMIFILESSSAAAIHWKKLKGASRWGGGKSNTRWDWRKWSKPPSQLSKHSNSFHTKLRDCKVRRWVEGCNEPFVTVCPYQMAFPLAVFR